MDILILFIVSLVLNLIFLFKFQKLMSLAHEGVVDRLYEHQVKGYSAENNYRKVARIVGQLISKKNGYTFSK